MHRDSDIKELEEGKNSLPSPAPPPSFSQLLMSSGDKLDMDLDSDKTLISPYAPLLPLLMGIDETGQSPQHLETPNQRNKTDLVWIVKRTRKLPADPLYMQSPSTGQCENDLSGLLKLPKFLTYTPRPVSSFLTIHLSAPPWYNLLPDQQEHFNSYSKSKVWVRDWQASKDADVMATSNKLKELIKQMTREKPKLSILQPEKDVISKKCNEKHKPSYHFLISGILGKAQQILLANPIISTPGASMFFLPYIPPTPHLLCTIEEFSLSIQT
ncbi:hypothetical protein H2248_001659 [Termitomyces sp. 'cryptogamus']|nr:hypothetical protein H2248_001659 [Termitomyces sp. 'cryptogamus']